MHGQPQYLPQYLAAKVPVFRFILALIFDLLTSKVVRECRITWATFVSLLDFVSLFMIEFAERQRDRFVLPFT